MFRIMLAVVAIMAAVIVSALAQSDVLPSTALMRDQGEALYRDINRMVRGQDPFDAAKADAAIAKLIDDTGRIAAAFPESSKGKTSPETRFSTASKFWDNKTAVDAYIAKLAQVLRDNRDKAKTPDGLKEAFTAINGACNACHEDFRLRRS